jgi:hypothetical protein
MNQVRDAIVAVVDHTSLADAVAQGQALSCQVETLNSKKRRKREER